MKVSGRSKSVVEKWVVALIPLILILVLLDAIVICGGCGNSGGNTGTNERKFSLEENLQGFTNELDFEITDPMYSLLTAKVLKVEDLDPYDLVMVEVEGSRFPSGLKDNPYEGKSIAPGTWLAVEWTGDIEPQVDKVYMIPSEFVKAVNGIKISLKGTPREVPGQSEQGETEGD